MSRFKVECTTAKIDQEFYTQDILLYIISANNPEDSNHDCLGNWEGCWCLEDLLNCLYKWHQVTLLELEFVYPQET